MESIMLGLIVLALLIPMNEIILSILKYKPDYALAIPTISLVANLLVVSTYGLLMKGYSEDPKLFIAGILLAIFISMLIKLKKALKINHND